MMVKSIIDVTIRNDEWSSKTSTLCSIYPIFCYRRKVTCIRNAKCSCFYIYVDTIFIAKIVSYMIDVQFSSRIRKFSCIWLWFAWNE